MCHFLRPTMAVIWKKEVCALTIQEVSTVSGL